MRHLFGDIAIEKGWKIEKLEEDNGKKVAVVGGGPAGIVASAYLARRGFKVRLYEKHDRLRGTFSIWNT